MGPSPADTRVKSAPTPRPVRSQPTGIELTVGDEDVTGQCEGQPRTVDVYEIQFTHTCPNLPNTTWQHAAVSRKTYFELKNLPTGPKVRVRLRASNTSGTSTWSDPASKRVP